MIALINRRFVQPFMAWRAGSKHLQYLSILERRQFDDLSVIRERQWNDCRAMLHHAYHTVPYYREQWDRLGLQPEAFHSLDDLRQLPVLTKAEIRAAGPKLRSTAFLGKDVTRKTTSGSTGVPLEIFVDRDAMQWKAACTLRSDQWSGWRRGRRVAKVWGNPEYRQQGLKGRIRNFWVDRATYLDTLGIDRDRLHHFTQQLQRKAPSLLFGHAHSLFLLACHVRQHAPGTIQPDGIISTAMLLHDWQRKVIEEAFTCQVTNRYGCEETSLIASECEVHQGLHLNADSLFAETLEDGEKNGSGKGALVLTDLRNYAMPLLRYKVGDVVVPTARRCSCGRGLPLIEQIEGREADFVVTPTGKLISGISLTENFAMHIPGAEQVQLVQEELRFLRVRMVPGREFEPHGRQEIANLVEKTFGPEMRHEVELVESIPQEPSGKYRFCISKVATEYLQSQVT